MEEQKQNEDDNKLSPLAIAALVVVGVFLLGLAISDYSLMTEEDINQEVQSRLDIKIRAMEKGDVAW